MQVLLKISNVEKLTTEEILTKLGNTSILKDIKKILGADSNIDIQIVGGRVLELERLSEHLFKRNILKGNPLFTGHSEIIRSYVETENLMYNGQKVCMSQFFSNIGNQSKMTKRIWLAALAKLRGKSGSEEYLETLKVILMQLEPNVEFSY